jgi:hypothetical protein
LLSAAGLGVLVGDLLTSLTRSRRNRQKAQRRQQQNSNDFVADFPVHKFEDPAFGSTTDLIPSTSGTVAPDLKPHNHRFDYPKLQEV